MMKKLVALSMSFIFLIAIGCNNAGNGTDESQAKETTDLRSEIEELDSVVIELDELKTSIEESANEVDELLNEL